MKTCLITIAMFFSVVGINSLTLSEAVEAVVDEHLARVEQHFSLEATAALRYHTQDLVEHIIATSGRSEGEDFGKGIWIHGLTENILRVFYLEYERNGLTGLRFLLSYRFGELPPAPTNWDEADALSAQLIEVLGEEIAQNFIFNRQDLGQLHTVMGDFHFGRAMSMDVMVFLSRHWSDDEITEFLEMDYLDRYFRLQDAVLAGLRDNISQVPGLVGVNVMGVMVWDEAVHRRWQQDNWVFALPPRERMVSDLVQVLSWRDIDIVAHLGDDFGYYMDFIEAFAYENGYWEARWGGDSWFHWFLEDTLWRYGYQEILHGSAVVATLVRTLGVEFATKFLDEIISLGVFQRSDIYAALYHNQDLDSILEEYGYQLLDMLNFDIVSALTLYMESDGYMTTNLALIERLLPDLLYRHQDVLRWMVEWGFPVNGNIALEFTEADLDLQRTMSPVLSTTLSIEQPIEGANLILHLRNDSDSTVFFDIFAWNNTWTNDIHHGEYLYLEIPYQSMAGGGLQIYINSISIAGTGTFEGIFTIMFTRNTQ
ncbi:MAG: hypothetical protein FWD97_05640 [Defluviitaleaceae bacterium]|nr:hypothetical protein [Defluviitaleaceae bacterium]